MKYKFILILIILIYYEARSQDKIDQLYFNISYFGILGTHPGIKLGVQYPLVTFNKSEPSTQLHQMIGSPNVIFYFHRRNQLGIGFNIELGYKNKQETKINKEMMLGIGYLRTFIPNKVYEFSNGNFLNNNSLIGSNHFIKTLSLGIGKNINDGIHSDFWMIKPTLLHLKPYNTKTSLNFALDVGYQFK